MKQKLLAFDYYFQVVTFSLVVLASLSFFGLMLLVPFGAYQVLSAAVKGVFLNNYRYRIFALLSGGYGAGIMFVALKSDQPLFRGLLDLFPDPLLQVMALFLYLVIPITSAIFYLRQSRKDFEQAQKGQLSEYL